MGYIPQEAESCLELNKVCNAGWKVVEEKVVIRDKNAALFFPTPDPEELKLWSLVTSK